jgi:hypothetical protein
VAVRRVGQHAKGGLPASRSLTCFVSSSVLVLAFGYGFLSFPRRKKKTEYSDPRQHEHSQHAGVFLGAVPVQRHNARTPCLDSRREPTPRREVEPKSRAPLNGPRHPVLG